MPEPWEDNLLNRGIGHPYRTRGGFKNVELNVVGWSAVIGAGLAVGLIVSLATKVPTQVAMPLSVVTIWALLVSLDRYRWRNSMVHLCSDTMTQPIGESLVTRLQAMGIAAVYRELTDQDEDGEYTQRGILCRQADSETVRSLMEATETG